MFMHQGFPEQWIDSLDVDVIIPGYGEICDKSYIPEQISFIQEWIETVKEAIRFSTNKIDDLYEIITIDDSV